MRTLGVIEGQEITEQDDLSVTWVSKAAIDGDGNPNPRGDRCWQRDTSLHLNGNPINAGEVPFIVVPPLIERAVKGVVLGCRGLVEYNQSSCASVVADTGPRNKLGEISEACADALGIPDSPVNGGEFYYDVRYTIWPGVPAVVNGVTYDLQPIT